MWKNSASLIILARKKIPQSENFNVLLLKRSDKSSFFPNHGVFPGGITELSDESEEWLKHFQTFGINYSKLSDSFKIRGSQKRPPIFQSNGENTLTREISLRITAIRETFEEVGVLMCKPRKLVSDNNWFGNCVANFDRKFWQEAVHNDSTTFLKLCRELDVVPDVWSLHEWSVWLTPAATKKRYETAFFIVALNEIPSVMIEESEVKSCLWRSPSEFINMSTEGTVWLPPPQRYEISRLRQIRGIEAMINFAKDRSSIGSSLLLPILFKCTDGLVGILPGDDLYAKALDSGLEIIEVNEAIEEFNRKSKKHHRFVNQYESNTKILLNIDQLDGHLVPDKELNKL